MYSQGGFRALYFGMAANVLKVVPAVSIRSVTSNGYQVRPTRAWFFPPAKSACDVLTSTRYNSPCSYAIYETSMSWFNK